MANLKEVRKRIASVNTTKQITSAMKMVAAARLRKAQMALINFRPYALKMKELLLSVNSNAVIEVDESPYIQEREITKVLIIAIASNRGLCGSFNNNIFKAVRQLVETKYNTPYQKGQVSLITIGKTLKTFFKNRNFKIIQSFDDVFNHLNYETATAIANEIMQKYSKLEFDRVELVYNKFKNAAVQKLSVEQFLPIQSDFSVKADEIDAAALSSAEHIGRASQATGSKTTSKGGKMKLPPVTPGIATKGVDFQDSSLKIRQLNNYLFEPNQNEIVLNLIPKTLKVQFYRALLESYASEHGARMTAMHQATDNASDLIQKLTLDYNKARQAAITKEILEIVGGAEALKNG